MSEGPYHQAILERARAAVNRHLSASDASVMVDNPLCGDRVSVDLKLDGERIAELAARVRGCALCQAAAAVIAAAAPGERAQDVAAAKQAAAGMLRDGLPPPGGPWAELGIFVPVRGYKSRYDCVLLPFEALGKALAAAAKVEP
ncbi:MAG: iron-sulfur cluster assembly scaffold protein [Pseudomonadota bacterium]